MASGRATHALSLPLAIAALSVAGCGGPIRDDELKRGIESLHSYAAQGELLAHDVAQGRTRAPFARAFARELGEKADHEAEKLKDAEARPSNEDKKREAVALAEDISDQLGNLQVAPEDSPAAARTERTFSRMADDAEHLASGL